MDITMSSTTDNELDLDVTFVESDLDFAGVGLDTEDCTSDNCPDSRDPEC